MFAGQSAQHQNISHGTIQNGSQGVYGSARDVYFGSCTNPQEIIEQRAKLCRDALFVSEPEVDRLELVTNKGTRVTGTCEWIKNNGGYRSWNQGETPLLWVTGGPGKGKTMLSIFLTEDLEQELSKYNAGQLVYYFCIHKKRDKGTDLLRSLLYQIIDKRPELAKHAFTYLETPERRAHTLSSLPSLWIILQNIIADATLGDLFCIVDGLDECDEDTRRFLIPRFVDQLEPLSSPNQPESLFRLIIVSRDLEGLEGCEKIDLDEDHASNDGGDIELFVCEKVKELFQRKKLDVAFQPTVREALISGANGTFLWVGFVINELLKVRTWSQVCKQLKSLPGDLSNIYDRMLLGIPSENRETSSLILQWVCLAQRPLKVAELAQAVGLKPASQIICSKSIEPVPRSVLLRQTTMDEISLFGQMLKVEHEEVTLVHQSARDYLLRWNRDSNNILEFFRVRQKETHRLIARICFDCIAEKSDSRATSTNLEGIHSESSPLLHYAVCHWDIHARLCLDAADELFNDLNPFFQLDSTVRTSWWKSYSQSRSNWLSHTPPLLHIVSYIGVPSWLAAMLQHNPELKSPCFLDQKDEREMTPLHWAVRGGNDEVVQLLLVHGVDINAEDDLGFTPLQQSFENRDEVVAQRLLDQDAVFTIHRFGPNPFYQAAHWGNRRMLNILLERGPDINEFDSDGIAALHHAVLNGDLASVQLLLELGANSNAISDDPCNKIAPLHLVPEIHCERMIKLLFDRGADLEARDYIGRTPLYVSCQSGFFENVRLLMEMGANMWVKDDSGGTLLHAAVDSGSEAMVQLFLHKGLDFQAKNNAGETLLHQVAWSIAPKDGIAIFRLLISLGVCINEKNHEGSTALHMGAKATYPEIIQPLIEYGANLEARDVSGKTSLHCAILARSKSLMEFCHTETIRALIQGGADVSARDNQGYTPLDYADSLYRKELETWIKDRVLN